MGDTDFIRKSLFMIGGLLIWGAHFGFVYTFNALACAQDFVVLEIIGIGIVPLTVVGTTIIALAATLFVLMLALWRKGPLTASHDDRPVDDFMRYTTIAIAGLSLVAIAWNGLPAFLIPPCG